MALRQLLRQVSSVARVRRCSDALSAYVIGRIKDGVAHFSGIESCGRIWLCPVCAAKIRARRGDEIAEAVGRHIAAGGGAYFVTATLSHDQGDALAKSLDVLTQAWRFLTVGRVYQAEKDRFGIVGTIKAVEITHGRNGWHPHIHAVILTRDWVDLGSGAMADWFAALDARWARALTRSGWSEGLYGRRFRLDLVTRSTSALAAYVTKVQDSGLGNEIARSDLKASKVKTSRTPLQILADFGTDANAADLALWHEYEKATAEKSAIRWSAGLRALLLPDIEEQTNDEIAAAEVGGDNFVAFARNTYSRFLKVPGAPAAVLDAIETESWEVLIKTLISYRIGVDGVLTPEEWAEVDAANTDVFES